MRPRARAPTCPLATPLSFCPVSRFAPPSPTVRTSLLLSDDVCRRCNLACDRLLTLVVKFLHAPFWRPCTLAPGDICTPLPPLSYASGHMSCAAQSSISIKQTNFCASLSLSVDRALEFGEELAGHKNVPHESRVEKL